MLGNGRLEAHCMDGVKRLCHIRGKMRKKVRSSSLILLARSHPLLLCSLFVRRSAAGILRAVAGILPLARQCSLLWPFLGLLSMARHNPQH